MLRFINTLVYLVLLWVGVLQVAYSQTVDKSLCIQYESPLVARQGAVDVSLADFAAFVDWRVPEDRQRAVLASPSRIEGLLEAIVLAEGFMEKIKNTDMLEDSFVRARIYQAAAREARNIYRKRYLASIELEDYEAQARELYLLDPQRFTRRETIDFDHILVAVNSEQDEITAMRRAADAYESLRDGQSFSDVAEEFSDDPGFDEHQGRFSQIEVDTLVPSVAQAVETLDLNEWSVPVQSRFGWHILRITSINEAGKMDWDQAQPMAERIAREKHLAAANDRLLREINSGTMQFADNGVRTILDHYGVDGFEMEIPGEDDEAVRSQSD